MNIIEAREKLKDAEERLLDVQTRGDKAISKYDMMFGYDANFYLKTSGMLQHHVNHAKKQLDELLDKGEQLTMF